MKPINICLTALLFASTPWSALHADPAPTAADAGLMVGSPPPPDKIVTIDNFLQAPYNRWSLLHLREIVPTRDVPRGRQPVKLPRKLVDLSGLKVDLGEGRSRLEWACKFTPAGDEAAAKVSVEGMYGVLISWVKEAVEG